MMRLLTICCVISILLQALAAWLLVTNWTPLDAPTSPPLAPQGISISIAPAAPVGQPPQPDLEIAGGPQ